MHLTSLLIDRGYFSKKNVPGFPSHFSLAAFPFWAEYTLLDFAVFNACLFSANSDSKHEIKTILICDKDIKKNAAAALSRWEELNTVLFSIDNDMDFITEISSVLNTGHILLYDINQASLISEEGKKKLISAIKSIESDEIIKLSIDNVPVDVYAISTGYFISLLEKNRNLLNKDKNYLDVIIDEIMTGLFDHTIDIEGSVYFNSSITQFYESNISLLSSPAYKSISDFLEASPSPSEKDSVINKSGMVSNSIVASNVKIDGYVENSIIFSDVIVKSNAKIINSVIMNGNQIGKDVSIINTLIFPNMKNQSGVPNIQDKSLVGGNSKKTINANYPDQIYNGITFLGANSLIPRNFIIEAGAFLGADVSAQKIKKSGRIPRSGSIE